METNQVLKEIERDAARHERELAVVQEPQARSTARTQAAKFASAGLATVDQLSRNQCNDYTRRFREWFGSNPDCEVPHPVAEHQRSARLGRWGTKLLMGFEVVFAAWITATFNFAQHLWAAMAATAGLWLAASTGLSQFIAMLLKRRAEVPQETRNRIHQAVRWFVIVWLAGAAIMLIMRTAQGKTALILAHATTYVLAAWAVDTILLAGCGIGADRLFRWSGDATREYYATARVRSRLAELLERCSSQTVEAPPAKSTSFSAAKLAVALLAVAMGITATTAKAQSAPAASAQRGCTYIDETTSVQSSAVQSVLDQHKQLLPELASTADLKSWCFVPFTANAWSAAPAATVEVTRASQTACAPPALGEADALFRGAREERLKKSQQVCAAAKNRAAQRFEQDLTHAMTALERSNGVSARCSSVLDALDRVARSADLSYAVVVTDGQENCGPWRTIEAPAKPMHALVVLLPASDDEDAKVSPAVSFERRKAALLHAAPWISAVVPPWAFHAETLHAEDTRLQAHAR
jgi:uncharacterized membrane protein